MIGSIRLGRKVTGALSGRRVNLNGAKGHAPKSVLDVEKMP